MGRGRGHLRSGWGGGGGGDTSGLYVKGEGPELT